ncbi:MAG: NUDIX domain-containing protein [Deltaproteobacteria bacterium]|nr:NUDIX domain-containing protein [Deltaproteobacteria bacterium]
MKLVNTLFYRAARLYWQVTGPLTVGVRVCAVKNDAVLLVKPTYQKYWCFPGGGVKRLETLVDAARRETREEAGAILGDPLVLMGVYTAFGEGKSDHVALFLSRDFTMNGRRFPSLEIERCAFFPLDRAISDKAVSPATRRRLREYLAWDGTVKVGGW